MLKFQLIDKVITHGVSLVRTIRAQGDIKSLCYNRDEKKIIILDDENYVNFYKSDGRFSSNFLGVDFDQDTSNKFIKYLLPNKEYDNVLYCSADQQYITWKKGEIEINVIILKHFYFLKIFLII